MVDSGDRKRQVSLFESFGSLKKVKINEASSSTSVEASFGDDVSGDCSVVSRGHTRLIVAVILTVMGMTTAILVAMY